MKTLFRASALLALLALTALSMPGTAVGTASCRTKCANGTLHPPIVTWTPASEAQCCDQDYLYAPCPAGTNGGGSTYIAPNGTVTVCPL
jgi:hypothetical protein